jgi:hypothetical protein
LRISKLFKLSSHTSKNYLRLNWKLMKPYLRHQTSINSRLCRIIEGSRRSKRLLVLIYIIHNSIMKVVMHCLILLTRPRTTSLNPKRLLVLLWAWKLWEMIWIINHQRFTWTATFLSRHRNNNKRWHPQLYRW